MIGLRDQAEGFQAPLKLRASAAKQPAATRPSDVSRKTICGCLLYLIISVWPLRKDDNHNWRRVLLVFM